MFAVSIWGSLFLGKLPLGAWVIAVVVQVLGIT